MVYSKQKFHPGSLDLRRVAWWKLSLQKYTFFNIQTFFDNYFFNRQRLSCRPANAPFRLASLPNRKQHALPKPTLPTEKRGLDRSNGTSDPQEQRENRKQEETRKILLPANNIIHWHVKHPLHRFDEHFGRECKPARRDRINCNR